MLDIFVWRLGRGMGRGGTGERVLKSDGKLGRGAGYSDHWGYRKGGKVSRVKTEVTRRGITDGFLSDGSSYIPSINSPEIFLTVDARVGFARNTISAVRDVRECAK